MRTEIQNKLYELCKDGTFAKVTYTKGTDLAVKSTTEFLTPSVVVGETSGTLTSAIARSPRERGFTHDGLTFEARLKFTSEVDVSYFLENELNIVVFSVDNTKVRTTNIAYVISQPPRQGSHNGTEMVITFSLTTRR